VKRTFGKWALYSAIAIAAVVLAGGGYVWYSVEKTMDTMYEPLPSANWVAPDFEDEEPVQPPEETAVTENGMAEETGPTDEPDEGVGPVSVVDQGPSEPVRISEKDIERLRKPNVSKEDPFAMLLLGVDERPGDRGRSDTMILIMVQPKNGKAVALSIPRDTRVRMPNTGNYDKINHAYAFGGTPLSVQAVENLFGVPIAYYMKTNMDGLVRIVDTLGGVDVDNQRAFDYEGHSFPAGKQHLDGEGALAYSRMRKQDPQGDFGRTQRQRQILSGAVDKIANANSVLKLPKLLSHLSEYVRTNLGSGNMKDLLLDYRPAIGEVNILYLQGSGKKINGIYYYAITAEERRRIQAELLRGLIAD